MNKFEKVCKDSNNMNERNDCTVKALSITGRVPYNVAHTALKKHGRKDCRGCYMGTQKRALVELGLEAKFIKNPRQPNGSRFTPKTIGKTYSKGYYMVWFRSHVAAMVNGEILDWTDGRQHRVVEIARITKPRKG